MYHHMDPEKFRFLGSNCNCTVNCCSCLKGHSHGKDFLVITLKHSLGVKVYSFGPSICFDRLKSSIEKLQYDFCYIVKGVHNLQDLATSRFQICMREAVCGVPGEVEVR
jgi:hypothetical protein